MNFTYCIETLNVCTWRYREVATSFLPSGTVALAIMPTMRVLSTDVFPTTPNAKESRKVLWNMKATVTVTDPKYPQLSALPLTGSTEAMVSFNADGSIINGCTDCIPDGTTIGGGITLTTGTTSTATLTNPQARECVGNVCGGPVGGPAAPTERVVTEHSTAVIVVTGVTTVGTVTVLKTAVPTATSVALPILIPSGIVMVDSDGAVTTKDLNTMKVTSKTFQDFVKDRQSQANVGASLSERLAFEKKTGVPHNLALIATEMGLELVRIEYGDTVRLVNPAVFVIAGFFAFLFVAALIERRRQ